MNFTKTSAANNSRIFPGIFYRGSRPSLAAALMRRILLLLSFFAFAILPLTANASNHLVLKKLINPNNPVIINPNIVKKKNLLFCLAPFIPNGAGTKCVCPVGKVKVGNTCQFKFKPLPVPLPLFCAAPFVPNAAQTKCVCPAGKIKVGNTCQIKLIPLPQPPACNAPFVPNAINTKCVCPAGTQFKFGTCVPKTLILCTAPFVPNFAQNQCVCPAGLVPFQNSCVPPQTFPQPQPPAAACKWPFVYSNNLDACVCSSGYRLNSSGNSCIRKQTQSPSVPRDTVRQIQVCLAIMGYEPGPADGVSGRKTRQSWSQFRLDENLQNRSNRLSDPVIQDRLFQKCDTAQNEQPAPPETMPVPPIPPVEGGDTQGGGIITNFDPQTGYPPLQCATPGLLEKLKETLGEDLDIGLCGQSCTPIPPGMSPSQIAATGNNVNWCLSCSKIGNELLCSANPPDDN